MTLASLAAEARARSTHQQSSHGTNDSVDLADGELEPLELADEAGVRTPSTASAIGKIVIFLFRDVNDSR